MEFTTCIQSFVDVVDFKGFSSASRRNHVAPSVLSKRVAWLEKELGKPLLYRTTRHFELTPAGKIFYESACRILEEIIQVRAAVKTGGIQTSAKLTISCPSGLVHEKIMGQLYPFLARYPKAAFHIIDTNSPIMVVEGSADIAISTLKIEAENLVLQPLGVVQRKLFAAPSYLKKNGVPRSLDDLAKHHCLLNSVIANNDVWTFAGNHQVKVTGTVTSDSNNILIAAAADGFGIIWNTVAAVRMLVEAGCLQEIKLEEASINIPVNLYHRIVPREHIVTQFSEFILRNKNQ